MKMTNIVLAILAAAGFFILGHVTAEGHAPVSAKTAESFQRNAW